jgi:hypothetical protein
MGEAEVYTAKNALSWRLDPLATGEIEERLAGSGFDQSAITMEAYVQAREIFSLFEGLLQTAQVRRLVLLKEIESQRWARARATCRSRQRYIRPTVDVCLRTSPSGFAQP